MGRKVFLSVLGTTPYQPCHYVSLKHDYKSGLVRFIQEAMLELLNAKQWPKESAGYIFVTSDKNGSYYKNYLDDGHRDRETNEVINCEGLKTRINKLSLPFEFIDVKIKDGNNEKEIWQIFETIYQILEEDDEIYFDITHSFRFMPMLILVLSNYAKFLKSIKIKQISYGNYEGRNQTTNEAPIIDLIALSNLQDWTNGVNQFVTSGSVYNLTKLIDVDSFAKALMNFSNSFAGSRGVDIWEGTSANQLATEITNIQINNYPPPFQPIFSRIKKEVSRFDHQDIIHRGIEAISYCHEHNLLQQGITLLSELIVTYVLSKLDFDWKNEFFRNIVSNSLSVQNRETYRRDLVIEVLKKKHGENEMFHRLLQSHDNLLDKLYAFPLKKDIGKNIYSRLAIGTRNDINHAGIREKPKSTEELKDSFLKYFTKFKTLYYANPCS